MTQLLHTHHPVDRARILKAAANIGLLGSNTASGPRLMATLCNPEVSAQEVTALISREPNLYARVLRVANSSYYAQARSITSIERALVLLGLDAVRGITAAACLNRTIAHDRDGSPLDMSQLLNHSLATATAAQCLARIHDPAIAADAFIAGLLHNLGIAVQIHIDTPGIRAMLDVLSGGTTRGIRVLESESAAVSHEDCAAVIFEEWQLPVALVAAARHHHDPMSAPADQRALTSLVNLGATMALAGGNTFALEPAAIDHSRAAIRHLGLADADLEGTAANLPGNLAELRCAVLAA
jgi:HD-like signal output (HDOD) protein